MYIINKSTNSFTDGTNSFTNTTLVTNSTHITNLNGAVRSFTGTDWYNSTQGTHYIDNLGFYNVALSQAQITAISKNPNGHSFIQIGNSTILTSNTSLV